MSSTPDAADARLLDAHDLALAALHEITAPATVGPAAGYTVEDDGAVSLRFASAMAGYPGWFWTVSVAVVDGAEPTVLEAELLPGDGALLAPEWVPWAVRLADYQATQAALAAEQGGDLGEDDLDDDDDDVDDDADDESDIDDLDDLDAADFDQDGSPILHAGDVDGVDIDVLDDSALDDDEDDDQDDEDDDQDDADDDQDDADDDLIDDADPTER